MIPLCQQAFALTFYPSFQIPLAENGLHFIETSALDASNVELAFQKILTGKNHLSQTNIQILMWTFPLEIYRIVSNKAMEEGPNTNKVNKGETIKITPSDSKDQQAKGGCCQI